MPAADLITLDRLLDALDKVPGDMELYEIDKFTAAITSASVAIRNFTDREFVLNTNAAVTTREVEWDDSGYVDIPDAQGITSVTAKFNWGAPPVTLRPEQWRLMPFDSIVKDTLIVNGPIYGMSPAMGFTWNLDRFSAEHGVAEFPPILEVTGVFGWPEIPADVEQATIWTASAFAEEEKSVAAENISSFGRTYTTTQAAAIPLRARELLDQYKRITV